MTTATPEAIAEAEQNRWWRYRCGEPNLNRYPIRCKRDLGHEPPHVGIGHEPVVWDGEGNAEPGWNTGRCWCTLRRPATSGLIEQR